MKIVLRLADTTPTSEADHQWAERTVTFGREGEVIVYTPNSQEVERIYLPGEWLGVEITP